ncbi:MAG: hypothetical protein A2020_01785 [Lentisphaerae bacterium GWF2_45_14]|nr:MAG: hypothetical protein A2020_01785 [Lentisphaerae bacterium GWF2_45_14]
MNILFLGDIVGKGGRQAVLEMAPLLKKEFNCQFVVANAENVASGAGLSAKCIQEMTKEIDVFTSGDHVWDQKNFVSEIKQFTNVLRPGNVSKVQPGKCFGTFRNPACGEIAVINLLGRVFMRDGASCPFETADKILNEIPSNINCVIVDFHAEATSEKAAMAHFLDGRVTAVIGTHTHVQTNDCKILPKGTAFISDAGMAGAEYSILGRTVDSVLRKFISGMPERLPVVETGIRVDGVVISYGSNGRAATGIKTFSRISSI